MGTANQLTQISKGEPALRPTFTLALGPIADKFFVIGALASLIGIGWLGTHLWLALNGEIEIQNAYLTLRHTHVLIQIYLFLGLFVLGFVSQASAKLLGSPRPVSFLTLLYIPFLIIGVALSALDPLSYFAKVMISSVFLAAFVRCYRLRSEASPEMRASVGNLLLLGLFFFSISPFLDLGAGEKAVLFFWGGLGSLIIATGQPFIATVLGGRRCSQKESVFLQQLLLITLLALIAGNLFEYQLWWPVAGATALVAIVTYLRFTNLLSAYSRVLSDALVTSFFTCYLWAVLGCLVLVIFGSSASDRVFHIWSIGWASTLIFSVSAQILGHMSGHNITRKRSFIGAILIWQVVPFGRALSFFLTLPPWFSWLVSVAASLVLSYWCYQLVLTEWKILQESFSQYKRIMENKKKFGVLDKLPVALQIKTH